MYTYFHVGNHSQIGEVWLFNSFRAIAIEKFLKVVVSAEPNIPMHTEVSNWWVLISCGKITYAHIHSFWIVSGILGLIDLSWKNINIRSFWYCLFGLCSRGSVVECCINWDLVTTTDWIVDGWQWTGLKPNLIALSAYQESQAFLWF